MCNLMMWLSTQRPLHTHPRMYVNLLIIVCVKRRQVIKGLLIWSFFHVKCNVNYSKTRSYAKMFWTEFFCFYSVNGLIFEPCQIGDFCTWLFFSHPTSSYGNFFKYSKFSVVFFFSRLSNFHHVTKKSYILHCNTFFTWTTKKNNQLIKINIYLLSEEEEQCCLFAI